MIRPNINFFIVQNWRNSEAYIMSKPSDVFQDSVLSLQHQRISYPFEKMTNEDHYKLAAQLFLGNMNNQLTTDDLQSVFGDAENVKANMTVLKDYFRLIGKYN